MDLVTIINNHFTAVQALPGPYPGDNRAYIWLYRFAHALVANWKPVIKPVEKEHAKAGDTIMVDERDVKVVTDETIVGKVK